MVRVFGSVILMRERASESMYAMLQETRDPLSWLVYSLTMHSYTTHMPKLPALHGIYTTFRCAMAFPTSEITFSMHGKFHKSLEIRPVSCFKLASVVVVVGVFFLVVFSVVQLLLLLRSFTTNRYTHQSVIPFIRI